MSTLWSPQMRKWVRDADRHKIGVGFSRVTEKDRGWEGGGTQLNYLESDDTVLFLTSDDSSYMLVAGGGLLGY